MSFVQETQIVGMQFAVFLEVSRGGPRDTRTTFSIVAFAQFEAKGSKI